MRLSQLAETVQTIPPETKLAEAARIMARDSVGALLIGQKSDGAIEGIITDRDIVLEIARGCDPETASVAPFTERPVSTAHESTPLLEIARKMKSHGIRRIPLVDDSGHVTRIVSLDDLLVELGEVLADMAGAIRSGFQHEAAETHRTS